jgi:hypothetical protein
MTSKQYPPEQSTDSVELTESSKPDSFRLNPIPAVRNFDRKALDILYSLVKHTILAMEF